MSVLTHERETYEAIWGFDQYAANAPGESFADAFLEMSGVEQPHQWTVLDAGCGSGKGALALAARRFGRISLCDLTDAGLIDEARARFRFDHVCLWYPLQTQVGYLRGGLVDYIYCCDVLEHIPTAFVMLAVARLLDVAAKGAFFSIALRPDEFGAFLGKPLHQTVQSFVWWRDQLSELATMRECRDLGGVGLYFVEPRR